MLYPPDVKLLCALKEAQHEIQNFVVIDFDNRVAHMATGYYHTDVEVALSNDDHVPLPLSHAELAISIRWLIQNGLLQSFGTSPAYQVTYHGWYYKYVIWNERWRMALTHFLFPAAVAFVTTILTLLLAK